MAITHDYEVSRWGRGGDHVAEVRVCTWIEAMTVACKLVDAWSYDETDTRPGRDEIMILRNVRIDNNKLVGGDWWNCLPTPQGVLCDPNHPDDTHRDEGYA